MKKSFITTARKAQIALAIMTAVSCSFIGLTANAEFTGKDGTSQSALYAIAIGNNAQTGKDYNEIAIGTSANASGGSAIALGNGAKATSDSAIAIGNSASASAKNSVAIGTESKATEENTVSVGSAESQTYRKIVNVADGSAANDAATVGQLNSKVGTLEKDGHYITASTTTTVDSKEITTATTVSQNLKNLDDQVYTNTTAIGTNVSDLADADKGITDINGKLIGSTDNGYKATLTDGLLAVDEKVGNLNPKNEHIEKNEDGTTTDLGKYNVLDGTESLAENLESVDTALGDVNGLGAIKGLDGKNIGGEKKTEGEDEGDYEGTFSVASAITTVNDKVGDLDQTKDYDNIVKTASVNDNLATLDSKLGKTADGAYVSAANSVGANLNALDTQVLTNTNAIARVNDKVNKVGAGAAALAALHPLDFDPNDKFSFAAGYGNYMGENAVALGAFYRPNETVMVSVAGNMGNGENMVNAGVSFALGSGSKAGTSKAAMAKKIEAQDAQIESLNGTVAEQKQALSDQNEKLEQQSKEIAELKAMVQALAAK